MLPKFTVFVSLFIFLSWAPPAHAYIDPGTGSILIQGLIAAIAAIGVTLKLYWHRFTGFFSRRSDDETVDKNGDKTNDSSSDA